jgi:hypothetical protein
MCWFVDRLMTACLVERMNLLYAVWPPLLERRLIYLPVQALWSTRMVSKWCRPATIFIVTLVHILKRYSTTMDGPLPKRMRIG